MDGPKAVGHMNGIDEGTTFLHKQRAIGTPSERGRCSFLACPAVNVDLVRWHFTLREYVGIRESTRVLPGLGINIHHALAEAVVSLDCGYPLLYHVALAKVL